VQAVVKRCDHLPSNPRSRLTGSPVDGAVSVMNFFNGLHLPDSVVVDDTVFDCGVRASRDRTLLDGVTFSLDTPDGRYGEWTVLPLSGETDESEYVLLFSRHSYESTTFALQINDRNLQMWTPEYRNLLQSVPSDSTIAGNSVPASSVILASSLTSEDSAPGSSSAGAWWDCLLRCHLGCSQCPVSDFGVRPSRRSRQA